MTFPLSQDPETATPANGVVSFDLNLLGGYGLWMVYHAEKQQFEF